MPLCDSGRWPRRGPTGRVLIGPVVSLPECAGPGNRDCHPSVQKAEPTCRNPGLGSCLIGVRHSGFKLKHRPVPSPLGSRPLRPRWASADVGGHVVTFVVTFGQGGFWPGRGLVRPERGPKDEKTAISRGFLKWCRRRDSNPHPISNGLKQRFYWLFDFGRHRRIWLNVVTLVVTF